MFDVLVLGNSFHFYSAPSAVILSSVAIGSKQAAILMFSFQYQQLSSFCTAVREVEHQRYPLASLLSKYWEQVGTLDSVRVHSLNSVRFELLYIFK